MVAGADKELQEPIHDSWRQDMTAGAMIWLHEQDVASGVKIWLQEKPFKGSFLHFCHGTLGLKDFF